MEYQYENISSFLWLGSSKDFGYKDSCLMVVASLWNVPQKQSRGSLNIELNKLWASIVVMVPVSMAEQSKASTVFGHSNIGITGSNPARGVDVCISLYCIVLCR
jgi:hypothetical protein